jgi:alpha-L-fucosidase
MIKTILILTVFLLCSASEFAGNSDKDIIPSPTQEAFMKLKFGMFIHFGINTFNDKEWSYGDLPLSSFNPDSVSTDHWCRIAKKAGINYLIFTTKHVDGFCNWKTGYTDYCVSNTPYKKDIVAQLAASCKKYGLKLGLYYCLWDENQPTFKKDEHAYNEYVRNQITELLTNYGDIVCLWFDGFWKRQQSGWKRTKAKEGEDISKIRFSDEENFINAWRKEGAYRLEWDRLYLLIKSLQPDCIVFNNTTTAYKGVPLFPVDARPAEKGVNLKSDTTIWNWLGKQVYLPLEIETTLSQKGDKLFPSGNWFWHEWDHSVATIEQVIDWAKKAKRLNANLVINVGPMSNGKLRPEDGELLRQLNLPLTP